MEGNKATIVSKVKTLRILLANGLSINKSNKIKNGNIKKNSIKLAFWNVNRGYLSKGKIHEVENQMREMKLDICALAEVDIFDTAFHSDGLYNIEGFYFERPKSWMKTKRSRTIVYIKKNLKDLVKMRKDLMSEDQTDIWMEVKTPDGEKIVIGMYYREFTGLNGTKTIADQKNRLAHWIEAVNKAEGEGKEILLMGDFNLDASKLETEEESSLAGMMRKCCNENGLDQLVKRSTRSKVMSNRIEESCIDHIYSNCTEKIRKIKLVELSTSDHKLIKCERMTNSGITPEKVTIRSFKHFKEELFRADLKEQPWDDFWEEDDLDRGTELFTKKIAETLERHAPTISFIPKNKMKPWITDETKNMMRERDAAYAVCKVTKSETDISDWKKLRNKVVGMLRKDGKNKFDKSFKANDAWRLIKEVDNKADSGGPPTKLKINGKTTKDKTELAKHMNNFFVEKVDKVVAEIEKTEAKFCPVEHFKKKIEEPEESFEFKEIKIKETEAVIDALKNSAGCGADQLSNKVLKIAKPTISKQLTRIINQVIRTGTYPTSWKNCVLIPLFKKKDPLVASNYRPIHILPKSSLICEQVLLNQLTSHWKTQNITANSQHGYTKGRSCVTALTELYDNWARQVDTGAYVGVYLCDQSSAFELVVPEILDKKLEALKVKENARKLIKNYLTERTQMTKIGDKFSEKATTSMGVGAGSKIGPFLYSTYVMDLPKTTEKSETVCYSDDTTSAVGHNDPEKVVELLEADAKAITNYMRANRLRIAESKSIFLLATNKQKPRSNETRNLTLKLGDVEIKQSRTAVVLGLTINNDLDWKDHLFGVKEDEEDEGLIKKLKKRLGLARKVSDLPFKCRKMVMSGIFMGKLEYGLEVYGSATKGQLQQLQQLQNRAARMVTKNPRTISTSECLTQCGWMNIDTLIKKRILSMGYKIRLDQTVPYMEKFIGRRRKNMSATIPSYFPIHGRLLRESTIPRFVQLWNDLPPVIRESSPREFKVNMIEYLKKISQEAER